MGALVTVAAVAVGTVVPSTLGDLAPLPRIETFISRACGGSTPCNAPDRARWLASLERLLREKMPGLPAEDRSRLAGVIYEEAKAASLDPFFVLAVIAVESGFDSEAESVRGARGLMQLTPSTLEHEAQRAHLDPTDPDDPVVNVKAGVRYLRRLVRAFGSTDLALMAYNAGPSRILKYMESDGDVPERFQAYPKRVEGEMRRLRRRLPAAPVARAPVAQEPTAVPPRIEHHDLPGVEAMAGEPR